MKKTNWEIQCVDSKHATLSNFEIFQTIRPQSASIGVNRKYNQATMATGSQVKVASISILHLQGEYASPSS